jgi:flagellar export protein FliJ
MRGFVFRLQRALRFSILREDQKKSQIANALKRITFLETYLKKLAMQMRTALQQSHESVNSLESEASRQWIVPNLEESKRLSALLVEEKQALEERKKELVRLSQRRRSLESLQEKQRGDYRVEKSRREQKKVDEIVNLNRARSIQKGSLG